MSEMTSFEIAKVRFFPESVFTDPQQVVSHRGLSLGQRLAALVSWRMQVVQRLEASSPRGGQQRTAAPDEALIRRIDAAIEKLVARL